MCEFEVAQLSEAWFDLRRSVCLTASHFGDAIGVGLGKPYDFLLHLLSPVEFVDDSENSLACQHGIAFEPVINKAYERITGRTTKPGGFWILDDENDPLCGFIGASPDAIVSDQEGGDSCERIGLAEYKAPVYCLYSETPMQLNGIPRKYMAQMQGQMAVTHRPWCDFMVVCSRTREISLHRVFFAPIYWSHIGLKLLEFCLIIDTARKRSKSNLASTLDFPEANALKTIGMTTELFTGERDICVVNLLSIEMKENTHTGVTMFKSCANIWMSYDELIDNGSHILPECCTES